MTELERSIAAIEHGLLEVSSHSESPTQRMELNQRMKHYKSPGFSAAFVHQEELAWAGGFGVVETGGGVPVTCQTIFQAASISKPVTAIIALHLVEDRLLDLDAEVNDYLRSWKLPQSKYTRSQRKVTLRGMLAHFAGLGIRGYRGYPAGRDLPTLQQILNGEPPANSRPVRVVQAPGKKYQYSSGSYLVAQLMIEDVTGRPLTAPAKEIIFDQLGMAHSTFESRLPEAFVPLAATAHNRSGKPIPGKWHTYPEQAAASLWTTPSDLALLIIEVFKSLKNQSNRMLSAEMTRQMLTSQANIGVNWDCGLAFNITRKAELTIIGHPGWNEGYHSILLGCPQAGQALIWMTNGEDGRRLGLEVSRGLAEVVRWSWW